MFANISYLARTPRHMHTQDPTQARKYQLLLRLALAPHPAVPPPTPAPAPATDPNLPAQNLPAPAATPGALTGHEPTACAAYLVLLRRACFHAGLVSLSSEAVDAVEEAGDTAGQGQVRGHVRGGRGVTFSSGPLASRLSCPIFAASCEQTPQDPNPNPNLRLGSCKLASLPALLQVCCLKCMPVLPLFPC